MKVVRLYDPARQPPGWMQVILPTEFAAFATLADSGAACDENGAVTSADDASCVIFETLPAAETFCRARVDQNPAMRFDIVDAAGLLRPPLFTIVHPSRAGALDGSAKKMRWSRNTAIALLLIGPPLIWYDWAYYDGVMVMPTIVGINAVLIAIRLFVMNRSFAATERARLERVARAVKPD